MESRDRPPQIPRSAVLLGAAAATLVACTDRRDSAPTPPPSGSPAPSHSGPTGTPQPSSDPALVRLMSDAMGRELDLLAVYDDAIARAPRLGPVLRAFRAHHSEHEQRLLELVPEGTTFGSFTHSLPRDEPGLLRELAAEEERASRGGVSAAGGAPAGELALLLAEIAGSEAQHAALLRTIRPRRRR